MSHTRKVLVTGISRGIGKAIGERLAADGYWVVGLSRTRPQDLRQVQFHGIDLGRGEQRAELLRELAADGPFYGLVNNVGIVPLAPLGELRESDLTQAVALNLGVAIDCAQALLPGMREAGIGRIVNISSRAALGKIGRSLYSATKAGLLGLTRTWALELAAQGITVNAVAPGPIDTEIFRQANPSDTDAARRLASSIPVGRLGQPEDVAHTVAYLLDERAGFITGQTHFVCGGLTVGAA